MGLTAESRLQAMTLYETDFYAWTQAQIHLLKDCRWAEVDVDNLAEEIASLGRQERRELQHRLGNLLGHLLKWQYQESCRSNSWRATIREQRRRVGQLLAESPSLKSALPEILEQAYEDGFDLAVRETNLPDETFPTVCPYPLDQALDQNFWPEHSQAGSPD